MKDIIERFLRPKRERKGETPFPEVTEYKHFTNPERRHDAYEFCKELAEYLHRSKTKNIIFLDRAARMASVGLHEYWKEYFPDKEMPKIYFINPDAVGEQMQMAVAFTSFIGANPIAALEDATEEQQIEFAKTFKQLVKQKEERLVVFDTCTHTGRHLLPVMAILKGQGFSNLRVVTANSPDTISPIVSDAKLDRDVKMHSHYPFGPGLASMVKKGANIVSEVHDHPEVRALGLEVRRELRQIIRDKGT